jgi:hypothetical protein
MDLKGLGEFAITEPESSANTDYQPVYPFNSATQTPSGHLFELDDTPTRERVRLQHRTGTFVEMHPDGMQVNHIFGDSFHIVEKGGYVLIKGVCSIAVEGDASMDFQGDLTQHVAGDMKLVVDGKLDITTKGSATLVSEAGIDLRTSLLGSISLSAPTPDPTSSNISFQGGLRVNGEITAESIYSTGAVKAGTGIHAGVIGSANPFAGISTLGGIASGSAFAAPGVISSQAFGGAPGIIIGGLIRGLEVRDRVSFMTSIRAQYNTHIHPTPRGPSGPPISPMIP